MSRFFSQEIVPVQARYGAVFASHGTPVVEQVESRGISRLIAGNSPVMVYLVKSTEGWRVFVMVP